MGEVWTAVAAHTAVGRMADNVTRTRGADGVAWLHGVAATAQTLAQEWHFVPERVHPDSYRSLLLQGHLDDGRPAALKIEPVPTAQTAALVAFAEAGHGPPVYATAPTLNASLLGWVPGTPLAPTPEVMTAAAHAALAVDATTVPSAAAPLPGVPLFTQWMHATTRQARIRLDAAGLLGRFYDDGLLDADLRRAHQHNDTGHGLRHGDLVPPNALLRPDGTVAFIDPDPHYGPAEADLAWLALRLDTGTRVAEFLTAAHAAQPTLERGLLGWLAAHTARTYVAYKVAMTHDIPPGFLALAATPAFDW